ncbi:hypothetical protein ACFLSF_04150 [Candidatus Bipolaricaulota bacterium]
MKPNKERVYAALVALGIWILLGRTIGMMAGTRSSGESESWGPSGASFESKDLPPSPSQAARHVESPVNH